MNQDMYLLFDYVYDTLYFNDDTPQIRRLFNKRIQRIMSAPKYDPSQWVAAYDYSTVFHRLRHHSLLMLERFNNFLSSEQYQFFPEKWWFMMCAAIPSTIKQLSNNDDERPAQLLAELMILHELQH